MLNKNHCDTTCTAWYMYSQTFSRTIDNREGGLTTLHSFLSDLAALVKLHSTKKAYT